MNKMQHISIAFIDVNAVKFAYGTELNNGFIFVLQRPIYVAKYKWKRFNKSDRYQKKTHEVTRCQQALTGSLSNGVT